MSFTYPCPDCETSNNVHDPDCEYDLMPHAEIEKAYVDIVSTLLAAGRERVREDGKLGVSYGQLRRTVSDERIESGEWRQFHDDCLHLLKQRRRVAEDEEEGGLYIQAPKQRQREIVPQFDPLRTVYEHGPIDGCKDHAVYAMVSWAEFVGLDWTQTRRFVTEWLEETGAWEEQSWGESSIDELLDNKRHVHERGLRFGGIAESAKSTIESADHEPRLDAEQKAAAVSKEDYDG